VAMAPNRLGFARKYAEFTREQFPAGRTRRPTILAVHRGVPVVQNAQAAWTAPTEFKTMRRPRGGPTRVATATNAIDTTTVRSLPAMFFAQAARMGDRPF